MIQDKENGSAYELALVGLVIIAGGFSYLMISPMISMVRDTTNDYAAAGEISGQTLTAVEFGINGFLFIPVIIVLLVLGYVYVRHVDEKRRLGGY